MFSAKLAYQEVADESLDYDTLCTLAWDWQARRAADLAAKSVRDCSLFAVQRERTRFSAVWRDQAEQLQPLLEDLDGALAGAELLKDGGSATVARIDWQGRELVIKRYNLKSLSHRLQRCWRPTRAWHSWQAGHRLRVLGIDTPRPLAMVEERQGPLRGRGYLICEAVPGEDLVSACEAEQPDQIKALALAVQQLLQVMTRNCISHGDFKATNLLWHRGLTVIDLDAVRWHTNIRRWQKASAKDVARLLRNWQPGSAVHRALDAALNGIGVVPQGRTEKFEHKE